MLKDKTMTYLSLFLVALTAFFYYIIGNGYYMLALCLLPVVFRLFTKETKFDIEAGLWFLFFVSALFSLFNTQQYDSYIRFVLMILVLFVLKLIYEGIYGWQPWLNKLFYVFSVVHVVATILSLIVPDFILQLAKRFYSGVTLDAYISLFDLGAYAGITGQTSINGFYISIFISYVVCSLFKRKHTAVNSILFVVAIIALFVTQKRSMLLSNIVAIVVILLLNNRDNRKKSRAIFWMAFVALAIYSILMLIPATREVFNKMNLDDPTSGREDLWLETIEIWKESPILGIGAGSLVSAYDISSHNVYLQVLAEMGILGAASYVLILYTATRDSFKAYKLIAADPELTLDEKIQYQAAFYMQLLYIIYSFFGNPLYGINFILPYVFFVAQLKSYSMNRRKQAM